MRNFKGTREAFAAAVMDMAENDARVMVVSPDSLKAMRATEFGETYPDRKRGGVFGWHREQPHIPPYLAPQECGCHVDARALLLRAPDGGRLALEMVDSPFAFSALPYTPQQLEQAAHVEELPVPVRTVVTLCGAMRGVGGIDSWGSDVEEAFRLSGAEDREFTLRLII